MSTSSSAPKTAASETPRMPRRGDRPAQTGNASARHAEGAESAEGRKARGTTRIEQDGESAPRLPHEHDQSSDSQRSKESTPPRVGKQALKDVERGLVDTDRGLVAERFDEDDND